MKIKALVISSTLAICSFVTHAGSWSGTTYVKEIYAHSTNNVDGTIYFKFASMKNPYNCEQSDLIALKKSNKVFSELYSLILAAFATDQKVNYYVNGCDQHGYPELIHANVSM
ncbi:hypothetical protein CWC22_003900 [Pseudoalteromonas rubra]|uniref:Uncharacterized protein n=1 Tax=Pseudoalteromonas rubra TaxID=43658 RepID=A0A7S7YRI4_9GAMM|nr:MULTISPECIES: hypothetical protein [Pseudoalteromonas]QPB82198.1 hypothetical protein CWC22_003900 [Pseudoalteromonas rubra]